MFILLFFQIISTTTFIAMTQNQVIRSSYKLEYFNSDTLNLKQIIDFNDTTGISSCVISNNFDIYFTTFDINNNALYNFTLDTHSMYSISTDMSNLVLGVNKVYGFDIGTGHYLITQFANQNVTTKFIFDTNFRLPPQFICYINELHIFVVNFGGDWLITIKNWKILQMYKVDYSVRFVHYRDGFVYMLIRDTNCKLILFDLNTDLSKILLIYERFLYDTYLSAMVNYTMYSIFSEILNDNKFYLVTTNLTTLEYKISPLPFSDTIVCMKQIQ